jgi:1-acyl-sn-glycerol-3-phosphate acyltransferase
MTSLNNTNLKKATIINSQINPWLIRLVYPLGCGVVIPLYFRQIEVNGRENIPTTGPVIVAPTHRSRWDAVITPYGVGRLASGRDLRFMVMASEMKGIQGWLIRKLGGFPVNTNRPGVASLLHAVKLLSQGEMLVMFPEGGIFRDTEIHRLKPGVARIALEVEEKHPQCGIKILPINIQYSQPYPSWGTNVTVNIGKAIDVSQYGNGDIKQNTRRLTKDLEVILKQLNQEITINNELLYSESLNL